MVVGFNHNVRYGGELYHVQTEDSGLKNPYIITHLYRGGTIIASKKTSYADIAKVDSLDKVVEELMKEQHKDMLRKLKNGEFDQAILARFGSSAPAGRTTGSLAHVVVDAPPGKTDDATKPLRAVQVDRANVPPAETAAADSPPEEKKEISLDDLVLSYLTGEDE